MLPYNRNDNALVTTEKFLARENLSGEFKETIMNFINKNAHGDKKESTSNNQGEKNTDNKSEKIEKEENKKEEELQQPNIIKGFPIIDLIYY